MPEPALPGWTLRDRPAGLQWAILLFATILFIALLELLHLPGALLLGAMAAGISVAVNHGHLTVPLWPYRVAMGFVGCLIARSIGPGILATMARQWPVFLAGTVAVLIFSSGLGALLARLKILPGTTAIWGSAPGGASVMVLMADAFGGDMRLVAFMQYLRVVFVAIVASIVSRLFVPSTGGAAMAMNWFPPIAPLALLETIALAVAGTIVGIAAKIPAGPLLVPMFAGIALSDSGLMTVTLPPWLMAGWYAVLGWVIGLRFTRKVVVYAARQFPVIAASTLTLIALCGASGYVLHRILGIDMLSAYLATSPGGADSVAVIAASAKVDMPFVMAMQTARFMLVILVGPSLARAVARWARRGS